MVLRPCLYTTNVVVVVDVVDVAVTLAHCRPSFLFLSVHPSSSRRI